jgi:hypothetical protein
MIKHTFKEWVDRTGCYLYWDIKSCYRYITLYEKNPDNTLFRQDTGWITEISALCEYPDYDWEEGYFLSPGDPHIKQYSLQDWLTWLKIPITAQLETDRYNITRIEYYVYDADTQTCITPFIKQEI